MKTATIDYADLVHFGVKASAEKGVPFDEIQRRFLLAIRESYAPLAALTAAANAGFISLMAREGGAVSASDAAKLYGGRKPVTAEAMRRNAKLGSVIAVRDGLGEWLFPVWQFESRGGVIPGLSDVLAALKDGHPAYTDTTPITFFLNPSPHLAGRTPLEALKAGELDEVVREARATHE